MKPHIWRCRFTDLFPGSPKWVCALEQHDSMRGHGMTPQEAYAEFIAELEMATQLASAAMDICATHPGRHSA